MEGFPTPGTLVFQTAAPNSFGAADMLYLLKGDAASEPVQSIIEAPGVAFPPPPAFSGDREFTLQILHFNDLHGRLVRFTPEGDQLIFSRLAWKLASSRKKCRNRADRAVLALSAGDDCGGSVFDDLLVFEDHKNAVHPYYRLYSKLGIDAACIGNHDLDYGVHFLAAAVSQEAKFPLLAANITAPPEILEYLPPAALLVVKGVRIGVIGLVTRAETRLPCDCGEIVDPRPVAAALVKEMKPLCDVLIIASHLGFCMETSKIPMADCGDAGLARSLPSGSVDLIIGGHSHTILNQDGLEKQNIINEIPVVQAGANGEYIGEVELKLENGKSRIKSARLIPTSELQVDEGFEAQEVQPLMERAKALLTKVVGVVETDEDLSTEEVRKGFASGELALANYVSDALYTRSVKQGLKVNFAMIDASSIQQGFQAEETLSYRDCFRMMPYADTIRIYQLTGGQLLELLRENALRLSYPGEKQEERGFLQFSSQVRYTIEAGEGIRKASVQKAAYQGVPLKEQSDHTFYAASTCFVRTLSLPWESGLEGSIKDRLIRLDDLPYQETELQLRDEITAYIRHHGGITAEGGAVRDGRLQIKNL